MRFEFATASRILFGAGTREQVPPAAAELGTRILLVTGHDSTRAMPLRDQLASRNLHVTLFRVDQEPTIETATAGVTLARCENCDLVIGLGGGSVLDTGKAIALLLTNGGEPLDYLEVIGQGKPVTEPAAPCIAIPTTAGTGSEVTRNAVLESPQNRVKVSLRSPSMLPRLAIVDPELTYSMPPSLTAHTGLDALTQVLEPLVSNRANPMTDALCREGLARAAHSLRAVFHDGGNVAAREEMAIVSLFGGLALANAKLGAVHGIAGPLGGMFPVPHGAACAALLPSVMAVNVQALGRRRPDSEALRRYDEIARLLTGSASATAADGVAWIEQLVQELEVGPLRDYGLSEDDFPELIEQTRRSSSMQGNPIELRKEELREILSRAM